MMLDQVYSLVLSKDTSSPGIQICCFMMDQTLFNLGMYKQRYPHQILQNPVLAVAFLWHILFV